jgi:hypothetical protein
MRGRRRDEGRYLYESEDLRGGNSLGDGAENARRQLGTLVPRLVEAQEGTCVHYIDPQDNQKSEDSILNTPAIPF